jgi:hypothetical protein
MQAMIPVKFTLSTKNNADISSRKKKLELHCDNMEENDKQNTEKFAILW